MAPGGRVAKTILDLGSPLLRNCTEFASGFASREIKVENPVALAPALLEGRAAQTVAASRFEFLIRAVIFAGVVVVGAVLWSLTSLFLLMFASVLVGILLRAISEPLARFTHLPPLGALSITVIVLVAVLLMISILFGATVAEQFGGLAEEMPSSLRALESQLGHGSLADRPLSTHCGYSGLELRFPVVTPAKVLAHWAR